ncbi:MAG: hypothetical protein KDK70_02525, partial [Myxococcales bacterium]|nr:hypothetical protein [Myxococcales bacterium]
MNDHWSGSVRLPAGEPGARMFEDQLEFVRDLLQRRFPASGGYETSGARLGGPIEGVRWSATRGSFLAEVSVQRFARARSGGAPRTLELRFVASVGHGDACAVDRRVARRVVAAAVAGWSLGGMGLGALWLGSQGLLPV